MLRLLGRPELLERASGSRMLLGRTQPLIHHSRLFIYDNTTRNLSPTVMLLQARRAYSVKPPVGPATTPSSLEPPVLPQTSTGPSSSSKRKVDLHPAPKKPSTSASSSSASSSSSAQASTHSNTHSNTSSSTASTSTSTVTSESTDTTPKSLHSKHIIIPVTPPSVSAIDQVRADLAKAAHSGVLVPPPDDASRVGRLYHQAKELFRFYWGGLKAQYAHHMVVRQIKARVKSEKEEGKPGEMSRWETQFIRTHNTDLVKLVPFVLILLILEEVLPLVVIYAPFMLPSTTILASQAERIYNKQEEKIAQALTTVRFYLESSRISPEVVNELGIQGLDDDLAWSVCRAFSLSDRGPRSWVNRRLAKHLTYVAEDDSLLRKEGSGERLTLSELRNALTERGHLTAGLEDGELRETLRRWLDRSRGEERAMIGTFLTHALEVDVERVEIES